MLDCMIAASAIREKRSVLHAGVPMQLHHIECDGGAASVVSSALTARGARRGRK